MEEIKIKGHHIKLAIFFLFLTVLGFFVYTSFYEDPLGVTGKITDTIDPKGKIEFNAVLTVPELNVNGKFDKIEIIGGSDSRINAGNQEFYLGNSENNNIKIMNYSGEIMLRGSQVSGIDGVAREISINGLPITSRNKNTMSISSEENITYNFLEIGKKVYIKRLTYNTTGTIKINNQNIFDINGEEISIKGFSGLMTIQNNRMNLKGKVESLKILGEHEISVS